MDTTTTTTAIQDSNNSSSIKIDVNSEPKNITRVRSRSSRLAPVELHQSHQFSSFGDGGLGRRQMPSNILNSPEEVEIRINKSLGNSQEQHLNSSGGANNYYWGHECHMPFPVKVGRSPINHSNSLVACGPKSTQRDSSSPTTSLSLPVQVSQVGVNQMSDNSQSFDSPQHRHFNKSPSLYDRVMKDTVDILESPTTTDPDLYLRNSIPDISSPDEESHCPSKDSGSGGGQMMIGAIQISDYEGSPRRFGTSKGPPGMGMSNILESTIRHMDLVGRSPSPSQGMCRPGFPKRIVTSATTPEELEKYDKGKDDPSVAPYDYMYEFSETRKVLNEFFDKESSAGNPYHTSSRWTSNQGVHCGMNVHNSDFENGIRGEGCRKSSQDLMFLDGNSQVGHGMPGGKANEVEIIMRNSKNFTLSPETTDYDSNCGDLDSFSNDMSTGGGEVTDYGRLYTAMPVLEDGLSSGHASDTESHQNAKQSASLDGADELKIEEDVAEVGKRPKGEAIILGTATEGEELKSKEESQNVNDALKEIKTAIQRAKALSQAQSAARASEFEHTEHSSPIWVPRLRGSQESLNSDYNPKECGDDDELDTDLETDRLLGQQRLEDHLYQEDNNWVLRNKMNLKGGASVSSSAIRHDTGSTLLPSSPVDSRADESDGNGNSPAREAKSPTGSLKAQSDATAKNKTRNKEGFLEPAVLIEGVLFRAKYLGSTQLVCEGQPTKTTRMMQAEEAVSRIKAPEGENQPSTEVDLFISTEKIMVLNTDLKEIMMDHALRTISYIADIGELVVLMARRRLVPQDVDDAPKQNRTPKMICHVFESDEAQFIAQSIGQAFQVAYVEFLKANGIEDHSFVKEMDYQEVLNSQEIFGDELEVFAKKELQKEVVVPKAKGEILGVVIVESGWGSMLPTVVIANLLSNGAAARCGHLNIGDQIIAINGLSLVGLPLSTCQTYIRNVKNQTAVKFTVVPCAPVVEVKIKRPNTKYQLGFSVQNGVICSLLRGGIAERGGVRVGHRIIEINNQSVVAVPHEKIVNLLATSVGEILMKTMPTSMFRLLTGQENPIYI